MRRQARISNGGALLGRTASALQVWLWLLIFVFQNEFRISRSIQPGYLDFDNLPETNFTCAGKVIGGYYADTETSCQMFHVCTVGAENETMDIKFLCLNGTVFDQETRVCERVDEVDCTKSEKFYSLNLELYGSTLPPIIEQEQEKSEPDPSKEPPQQSKPIQEESDPSAVETSSTQNKEAGHQTEVVDSTEDPVQEIIKEEPQIIHIPALNQFSENKDPSEEHVEEEIESEHPEYEDEFTHPPSTSTTQTTTTTTTTKKPQLMLSPELAYPHLPPSGPHVITTPSETLSSLSPPQPTTDVPATSLSPLDPSLLSPQEFIYRHRGPGSEAISFQRQSARPADGVFITHAPTQQFDPFQYESSRTAPRPTAFVQRPQPSPFRTTTTDPRDQLLRPGPSSDKSINSSNRPSYSSSLPTQTNFPFDPFYYEHKRSDDSGIETVLENESFLAARSVAPPPVTERHVPKIKSPPRVIVTASASVSDSNGRRLNYTVGNVVSAVKPSVHINYDDYKESDVDPFFLDVPKLKRRRKSRSNRNKKLVTVPLTTINTNSLRDSTTMDSHVTSQATTTNKPSSTAWNPNDYVDDNYEPYAYVPPLHVHALLVDNDQKNHNVEGKLNSQDEMSSPNPSTSNVEEAKATSAAAQTSSSHSTGSHIPPGASPRTFVGPALNSTVTVESVSKGVDNADTVSHEPVNAAPSTHSLTNASPVLPSSVTAGQVSRHRSHHGSHHRTHHSLPDHT